MNDIILWILVDRHGMQYCLNPGIMTIFKCNFRAAMFSHYELDEKEEWQLQEIAACEEIFNDSYVNFLE